MARVDTIKPSGSILLVEDDEDIREGLSDLLEDAGYLVASCANGIDALERLRRASTPDVIVLDLMMPRMDGWQFRIEQRREPSLSSIPVIAVSADASPQAAAIDADAYLSKPLDYPLLLRTIERVLLRAECQRLEAMQKERDRLLAVGTLAAGLAHEINNPLAITDANLTLLSRQCSAVARTDSIAEVRATAERMRRSIADATTATERIASIVSSMYKFSRPESQDDELVDLSEVLSTAIQLVRAETRPRAELVCDIEALPRVRGNAARLGQVFVNLVLNAAQAIPEGRPGANKITVKARAEEDLVVIEVSDTGTGIGKDVIGRIYDPFFTTKPVGEGMGLGLTICLSAVQSMGGTIEVQSVLNEGTTFRIRLPAAVAEQAALEQLKTPVTEKGRRRILVIDDEPLLCNVLTVLLSEQHDVVASTRAREAVERLRCGERFDLILCDLMMPEMSGMEVFDVLSREAPDQATRMVFLTGGAFTQASHQFLDSVPNRHILKPFSVSELVSLVETVSPHAT